MCEWGVCVGWGGWWSKTRANKSLFAKLRQRTSLGGGEEGVRSQPGCEQALLYSILCDFFNTELEIENFDGDAERLGHVFRVSLWTTF